MSDINLSNFNSYTINNINIQCHDYYPLCVHDVTIKLNNNVIINIFMKGDEIANYFKYHKTPIPTHFCVYVCKQSNLN
jgi:hypothetical protein